MKGMKTGLLLTELAINLGMERKNNITHQNKNLRQRWWRISAFNVERILFFQNRMTAM